MVHTLTEQNGNFNLYGKVQRRVYNIFSCKTILLELVNVKYYEISL